MRSGVVAEVCSHHVSRGLQKIYRGQNQSRHTLAAFLRNAIVPNLAPSLTVTHPRARASVGTTIPGLSVGVGTRGTTDNERKGPTMYKTTSKTCY